MTERNEALKLFLTEFPPQAATFMRFERKDFVDHLVAIQNAHPGLKVALYMGYEITGPEGFFAHRMGVLGENGKGLSPFVDGDHSGELPSSADPSLTDQIKDHDQQVCKALTCGMAARHDAAVLLGEENEVEIVNHRVYLEQALEAARWNMLDREALQAECEEEEKAEEAVIHA